MLSIILLTLVAQSTTPEADTAERRARAMIEHVRRNPPPPIRSTLPPDQTPRTTVPSSSPVSMSTSPKPLNDLRTWVADADRPISMFRGGVVRVRLTVSREGAPTACHVLQGIDDEVDDLTCRLLVRRARFTPARNPAGSSIKGSIDHAVLWRVPQ